MIYSVIVTPTADAEAMDAFHWYANKSLAAAAKWHAGLSRALASLTKNPLRFPISEDDSEALGREVRMLIYGRRLGVYRILFSVRGDVVRVLRIRHSARGHIKS